MLKEAFVVFAAGAALAVVPTAALASTGPTSVDASTPGHFSYTDPFFGPVSCNEVHHPGSLPPGLEPGATTLGGYDTITCKLETPSSLGGQQFIGDWVSDFGTQFDQNTGPADFRVAPNGLSYHAVAWYPNG
jgi:hypothetical protein